MENRIKRLEFEEQRAKKLENQANKRVDNMINARTRHQETMMEKQAHQIKLRIDEEK